MAPPARTISGVGWSAASVWISSGRAELDRRIAEGAGKAYRYLQALYGMPTAILASGPRADGLRRLLEQELGMEVVCFARREELSDQEDCSGACAA